MTEDRGQRTEDGRLSEGSRGQEAIDEDQTPVSSGQRPIPIIAMTAHAMTGDHDKSLEAGMVDHVTKPIDPEHLFATLLKWIRPRGAQIGEPIEVRDINEKPTATATADAAEETPIEIQPDTQMFPTSLPGFDLDGGLKRLQGNRKLYRKLLLNFGDTYSSSAHDIRRALDSGDYEKAHHLVHSLKGVAANLAAGKLLKATVAMEKLVKHASPGAPPQPELLNSNLDGLKGALDQALAAVATLKGSQETAVFDLSAEASASPPAGISSQALYRLREAAEMGDVTEVMLTADEIAAQVNGFSNYRVKIAQLADDFDFDGIIQLIDQLGSAADT
jgi:CheY-like chemotaxis protein